MNIVKGSLRTLVLAAALAAAGCGGSGGTQGSAPSPPQPTSVTESFTNWSKSNVYALPEASQPVSVDAVMFTFDGDDNPNAYSDLLPAT